MLECCGPASVLCVCPSLCAMCAVCCVPPLCAPDPAHKSQSPHTTTRPARAYAILCYIHGPLAPKSTDLGLARAHERLLPVCKSFCNAITNFNPQIGGMREGDYLVAIGDRDVKWSSHADVVKEIKTAENTLRLRLVTPMDRSLAKNSYKEKASIKSSSVGGGSVSPTSTTSSSSSSGLYTPEEGLSPASSESSGSTR